MCLPDQGSLSIDHITSTDKPTLLASSAFYHSTKRNAHRASSPCHERTSDLSLTCTVKGSGCFSGAAHSLCCCVSEVSPPQVSVLAARHRVTAVHPLITRPATPAFKSSRCAPGSPAAGAGCPRCAAARAPPPGRTPGSRPGTPAAWRPAPRRAPRAGAR